jgi:osmotically-inducible protein OsmY
MNKVVLLFFISLFVSGCTTIGVGTAEVTGISLFHDRRDAQSIVVDEKIENDAIVTLNLHSDIFSNAHFNVTSYNGIVLVTGETPIQALLDKISTTIKSLHDVRFVQNLMQINYPTSYSTRFNDSVITARVKTALTQNRKLPGFDTTRIKVVTEDSRVFLMGIVYRQEADIVVEIARQQFGVREVIKVFEYI